MAASSRRQRLGWAHRILVLRGLIREGIHAARTPLHTPSRRVRTQPTTWPELTTQQLVFVGGLHRSGTTLVASLIADHADASGFVDTGVPEDEGQFLQSEYPIGCGGPGRFGFSPSARPRPPRGERARSTATAILTSWAPHWNLNRSVLVEKTPQNLVKMPYLQALFPSARFIVVVRHPVEVALATAKWRNRGSVQSLLVHWLHCHEIVARDASSITRLGIVWFDDLTARPGAVLADIERFCGLTPSGRVPHLDPERSNAYHRRWSDRSRRQSAVARRLAAEFLRFGVTLDSPARVAAWSPPGAVLLDGLGDRT